MNGGEEECMRPHWEKTLTTLIVVFTIKTLFYGAVFNMHTDIQVVNST
jgi:hypothetical protein